MLRFNEKHATDYYFKNMVEFLNYDEPAPVYLLMERWNIPGIKENGHGK